MTLTSATLIAAALIGLAGPAALALPIDTAPVLGAAAPRAIVTAQVTPSRPDMRRPTVCTEQYAPVCARIGGILKIYPNRCYARADGADEITDGPCGSRDASPTPK